MYHKYIEKGESFSLSPFGKVEELGMNFVTCVTGTKKMLGEASAIKSMLKQDFGGKWADLKNKISNIRSEMPNTNLSKRGNMAAAEVDIDGVKKEFVAHSKINSVESKGSNVSDFSYLKPENERLFTAYVDDKFPRYHDTEAKILEDIAGQIKDPNISETINLYSELPCC